MGICIQTKYLVFDTADVTEAMREASRGERVSPDESVTILKYDGEAPAALAEFETIDHQAVSAVIAAWPKSQYPDD